MKELARPHIAALLVYEPGKPVEEVARELNLGDPEHIDKLASNENMLGPSPKAIAAMQQAAANMHYYPDGGAFYLKQALGAQLNLKPDQLIIGDGSNELLVFLSQVFLEPGSSIVMGAQAFIVYLLAASMFEAKTIRVPMKNFAHDLDAMLAAIQPDTRLVYIANPNNPTGTVVSPQQLDDFMDRVTDNVVEVFDEAYVALLPPDEQPDTLRYVREGRNVFVLRTFSKTYGLAGLRIGYAASTPEGIALLNRVRQPFNVNAMAQVAALAALEDDEHVERTRALVRDGLAQLEQACRERNLDTVPSKANFLLIKTGAGRELFQALQKKRVIVRPMDGYGLPDYVRVTVGTREQNEHFIQALDEVLAERT